MAVAAIAHIYVFPAEPYQFVPVSQYGKITSRETNKINLDNQEEKPAILEQTNACVEAPGTSIRESVQDVVIGGGEHVVKDVALTISQAIEPVGKGVHLIQESFHHLSVGSDKKEDEPGIEVEEHVVKDMKADETELINSTQVVTQKDNQ